MSNEAGVTGEERDFIAEVIAEDKQRRTPRNHVTVVAKDAFDEEAERAKFEAQLGTDHLLKDNDGEYLNWAIENQWYGWLACAKQRSGAQ